MSSILLALTTLQRNEGQIPICTLPIRTKTCGGDFGCHFKPDVNQVLQSFQLEMTEEAKKAFAMPQKWFCNEFIMFTIRQLEEESKENYSDPLGMFLEQPTNRPVAQNVKTAQETKEDLSLEVMEEDLTNKNSISEMFTYLEELNMKCYYAQSKKYQETPNSEVSAIEMIACYQESDMTGLIPDRSAKVIFHILYHLDGRVEIIDSIITRKEQVTMDKILDFERSIAD